MADINFLPARYHEQTAKRRVTASRFVVIGLFLIAFATVELYRWQVRSGAEAELAELQPQYSAATTSNQYFAKLQKQVNDARAQADLFSYLEHPWPRTQIVAAVIAPLPTSILLTELKISREIVTPQTSMPGQIPASVETVAAQQDLTKLAPAERDLARLRSDTDSLKTVVSLNGTAQDLGEVHSYLGKLAKNDLVEDATLSSFEFKPAGNGGSYEFKARVAVRPGYGQPKGPRPTTPAANTTAATRQPAS